MSFVGLSSIIYSIQDNTEGVKVTDLNNIWEFMQKEDIPFDSLKGQDKNDETTYPYICHKYLYGFSTYDDSDHYLMERIGYEYK